MRRDAARRGLVDRLFLCPRHRRTGRYINEALLVAAVLLFPQSVISVIRHPDRAADRVAEYIIMPPYDKHTPKPFKQRKSLVIRKQEVLGIRTKFPNKIPVIIERYQREKYLPPLDKTKFLVPQELTMTQFVTIIRNRMDLKQSQAFYLLINNSGLASMSLSMAEVYKDHKDEDGFLYMTYASQEMFGSDRKEKLDGS